MTTTFRPVITGSCILAVCAACIVDARSQSLTKSPGPSEEMLSLAKALSGQWSLSVRFEPNAETPKGLVNTGTETWRAGPGGYTVLEEEHLHFPEGDGFLLGTIWWNAATKSLQGMECENLLPYTCDVKGAQTDITMQWDGRQFVIDEVETHGGKQSIWHETWSDITPTSFTQTGESGPPGGPRTRVFTIHATRVTAHANGTGMPAISPSGPSAVLRSLESALAGKWSTTYEFEAGGIFPAKGTGTGEEVWHVGPGGYVMTEEEQVRAPFGDMSLIAFHWWDNTTNRLRGMECANAGPAACDSNSYSNSSLTWDGTHLTIDLTFPQGDRKMRWHEVWTVGERSFTQTGDVGVLGGPLKRNVTIYGTRIGATPLLR